MVDFYRLVVMRRISSLLLTCFYLVLANAQEVETYHESGAIKSRFPVNEEGRYHGVGYIYDQDGNKLEELPFQNGQVHGVKKEFFSSGHVRSTCDYVKGKKHGLMINYYNSGHTQTTQEYVADRKNGAMFAYYPNGMMRMYGLMEGDSLLFAQRFNQEGMLLGERVGFIQMPIDTSRLPAPEVFFEKGRSLRRNQSNKVQVFIPQVPSNFISFASSDGVIERSDDEKYPLIIRPESDKEEFILYLRIKTHSSARPIMMRIVRIPVRG